MEMKKKKKKEEEERRCEQNRIFMFGFLDFAKG